MRLDELAEAAVLCGEKEEGGLVNPMTCLHVCFSKSSYELFVIVQEATKMVMGEEAVVVEEGMEIVAVEGMETEVEGTAVAVGEGGMR